MDSLVYKNDKIIKKAFKDMDKNKDGTVDIDELK